MEEGGQKKDAPTVFVSNRHPRGLFTLPLSLPPFFPSLPPSLLFFLPFFLSDWGRAHCAGQTGLNFKLPLLPECWDDRWELSCPAPLISSWAL